MSTIIKSIRGFRSNSFRWNSFRSNSFRSNSFWSNSFLRKSFFEEMAVKCNNHQNGSVNGQIKFFNRISKALKIQNVHFWPSQINSILYLAFWKKDQTFGFAQNKENHFSNSQTASSKILGFIHSFWAILLSNFDSLYCD